MKKLGIEPFIHNEVKMENVQLGLFTEIGSWNTLQNVELGDYSYTGPYCIFQNVKIGKFSNIAAQVRIGPTNHPMDRPTQHHFTYRREMYGLDSKDDIDFFKQRTDKMSEIGHDTWLGHGAIILAGVRVGIGAVIGAGSVVTKNIPDYAVAVGNPARVIRYRFQQEQQDALKRIAWWDWSHEALADAMDDFTESVDSFINKYKGN